ncbi:hypothetical protein H0E87_001825, partial [Populus deltoides]
CWCGCDGEWQWLLDEEDDELTMALAVLFSSVPPPPLCPSVSPAFRGQRPCAGNGQLDNVCRGMTAVTYAP